MSGNRIDIAFRKAKAEKRLALVAVVGSSPAPYTESIEMANVFAESGFDIIMVRLPTPFAWVDGDVLLKNEKIAVGQGLVPEDGFAVIRKLREALPDQTALMALTMSSAVAAMGVDRFTEEAIQSGVDGVDICDYPRIASSDQWGLCHSLRTAGIHITNPIGYNLTEAGPGSEEHRIMEKLIKTSSGFLFLMADSGGLSGVKDLLPVQRLRQGRNSILAMQQETGVNTPIVVVCGVSTPSHIESLRTEVGVDGAMMGSVFVRELQKGLKPRELRNMTREFAVAAGK